MILMRNNSTFPTFTKALILFGTGMFFVFLLAWIGAGEIAVLGAFIIGILLTMGYLLHLRINRLIDPKYTNPKYDGEGGLDQFKPAP